MFLLSAQLLNEVRSLCAFLLIYNELHEFHTIVVNLFKEPLIIDFFSSCHLVSVFSIVSSLQEAFKSTLYFFIETLKGVFKGNCD